MRCDHIFSLYLQVVEIVQSIEEAGVIHRDIKDENLLIVSDNSGNQTVKLIDFGSGALVQDSPFSDFEGKYSIKTLRCMKWA